MGGALSELSSAHVSVVSAGGMARTSTGPPYQLHIPFWYVHYLYSVPVRETVHVGEGTVDLMDLIGCIELNDEKQFKITLPVPIGFFVGLGCACLTVPTTALLPRLPNADRPC